MLLALAGCGSQVDGAYQGDVQAVVQGTLTAAEGVELTEPMNVALLWLVDDGGFGQRVQVQGEFPAGFSLELVEPPKDEWLTDFTVGGVIPEETRVGAGLIVAYPASLPPKTVEHWFATGKGLPDPTLVGASASYVVAWLEDDVQPNTRVASVLGGTMQHGFHLLKATRVNATEQQMDDYSNQCDNFAACLDELSWLGEIPVGGKAPTEERKMAEAAYVRCEHDEWKKAGCAARQSPYVDSLAPVGFDTSIDMVIVPVGEDSDNIDIPDLG